MLRKKKTEHVFYGTAQRLARSSKLVIDINWQIINKTEILEYPDEMMDKSLTYTTQIERVYRKASSRVKLLSPIRKNISPYTAEPRFYFYSSKIPENSIQSTRSCFGKRERNNTWETVICKRNRLCVLEVFKCLNGIAPINFNEYFSKNSDESIQGGIKYERKQDEKLLLSRVLADSINLMHQQEMRHPF